MLAWLAPLVALAAAAGLWAAHDLVPEGPDLTRCREVPRLEPDADADAWAAENPIAADEVFLGETLVCHRADLDRRTPGDVIASVASWSGLLVGLGVVAGLVFGGLALLRSWRFRADDPQARRAARLALSAVLALVAVPLLLGAAVLAIIAAAPIRG